MSTHYAKIETKKQFWVTVTAYLESDNDINFFMSALFRFLYHDHPENYNQIIFNFSETKIIFPKAIQSLIKFLLEIFDIKLDMRIYFYCMNNETLKKSCMEIEKKIKDKIDIINKIEIY